MRTMTTIARIVAHDRRFRLEPGAGTDAVHVDPEYAYAVAELRSDGAVHGTGLAFTLGGGNDLVCHAIEALGAPLVGLDIEAVMAEGGVWFRRLADHPRWRWLGPHKG